MTNWNPYSNEGQILLLDKSYWDFKILYLINSGYAMFNQKYHNLTVQDAAHDSVTVSWLVVCNVACIFQ